MLCNRVQSMNTKSEYVQRQFSAMCVILIALMGKTSMNILIKMPVSTLSVTLASHFELVYSARTYRSFVI